MEIDLNKTLGTDEALKAIKEGYIVSNVTGNQYYLDDEDELVEKSGDKERYVAKLPETNYRFVENDIEEIDEEDEETALMSFDEALEFMGEPPKRKGSSISPKVLRTCKCLSDWGYSYKQLGEKFSIAPLALSKAIKKAIEKGELAE